MATDVMPFMNKLSTVFNTPRMDRERGTDWTLAYITALGGFESAILDAAADKIIAEHNSRQFPTVALCRTVCLKVAADIGERGRGPEPEQPEFRVVSPTTEGKQRLIDAVLRLRQQKVDGQPFIWDGYKVSPEAGADMIGMAETLHERSKKEDYSYGLMAKECGV